MAKKNRDLFEVLSSRTSSGASGLVRKVQDMVSPSDGGRGKKGRRGSKKKGAAAGASGVVVAAVAFGCLVTGFAAGRFSSPGAVEEGLSTSNQSVERAKPTSPEKTAGFGVEPSRFGDRAAARPGLSDEKLVERLSQFFHPLLPFSDPEGPDGDRQAFEDAKRLALWLHGRGFENVRLWRFDSANKPSWVVVDYIQDPQDRSEYEKLSGLESPDFAPGLAAFIAKRSKPFKHKD